MEEHTCVASDSGSQRLRVGVFVWRNGHPVILLASTGVLRDASKRPGQVGNFARTGAPSTGLLDKEVEPEIQDLAALRWAAARLGAEIGLRETLTAAMTLLGQARARE